MGGHLPVLGLLSSQLIYKEPQSLWHWPVHCQTYGYLPSFGESLLFH